MVGKRMTCYRCGVQASLPTRFYADYYHFLAVHNCKPTFSSTRAYWRLIYARRVHKDLATEYCLHSDAEGSRWHSARADRIDAAIIRLAERIHRQSQKAKVAS